MQTPSCKIEWFLEAQHPPKLIGKYAYERSSDRVER